jgi:hypothetical protein
MTTPDMRVAANCADARGVLASLQGRDVCDARKSARRLDLFDGHSECFSFDKLEHRRES